MIRSSLLSTFALAWLVAGCASAAAPGATNDDPSSPAWTARPSWPAVTVPGPLGSEAVRELSVMLVTKYQHTTFVDETKRVFDYDCSGFVNYALSRSAPDALATLEMATQARPLAKDYVDYFGSIGAGDPWLPIQSGFDLLPGDVVAWLEPQGKKTADTGHVMIVHGTVTVSSVAHHVVVPVVDSTKDPHGTPDSRSGGGQGLGTGTIALKLDASGAPVAYRWSDDAGEVDVPTTIRFARLSTRTAAERRVIAGRR
jgi:hypothetical protein